MQINGKLKLVATDLDGTFLKDDKTISSTNLETLYLLGKKGIIRVAATGRSLHKTKEVIPNDVPFDYIVFSSGAGVFNWKTNELLYSKNISSEITNMLASYFVANNRSFHLFKAVPLNHHCWYFRGTNSNPEFERYFEFHNSYADEFPIHESIDSQACQFLVILPNDIAEFEQLKFEILELFPKLKIVRTSSPLHTPYIWMEIFHEDVSKGNGVRFVCEKENINATGTLGIGNDYNDIELLEYTHHSYLVENGPNELKSYFSNTISNEDDAFAVSVGKHL